MISIKQYLDENVSEDFKKRFVDFYDKFFQNGDFNFLDKQEIFTGNESTNENGIKYQIYFDCSAQKGRPKVDYVLLDDLLILKSISFQVVRIGRKDGEIIYAPYVISKNCILETKDIDFILSHIEDIIK